MNGCVKIKALSSPIFYFVKENSPYMNVCFVISIHFISSYYFLSQFFFLNFHHFFFYFHIESAAKKSFDDGFGSHSNAWGESDKSKNGDSDKTKTGGKTVKTSPILQKMNDMKNDTEQLFNKEKYEHGQTKQLLNNALKDLENTENQLTPLPITQPISNPAK